MGLDSQNRWRVKRGFACTWRASLLERRHLLPCFPNGNIESFSVCLAILFQIVCFVSYVHIYLLLFYSRPRARSFDQLLPVGFVIRFVYRADSKHSWGLWIPRAEFNKISKKIFYRRKKHRNCKFQTFLFSFNYLELKLSRAKIRRVHFSMNFHLTSDIRGISRKHRSCDFLAKRECFHSYVRKGNDSRVKMAGSVAPSAPFLRFCSPSRFGFSTEPKTKRSPSREFSLLSPPRCFTVAKGWW